MGKEGGMEGKWGRRGREERNKKIEGVGEETRRRDGVCGWVGGDSVGRKGRKGGKKG